MPTSVPAFQLTDLSKVEGAGEVYSASRRDAGSTGVFSVKLALHFDPAADSDPTGTLSIKSDLSDGEHGVFTATSIALINAYGKDNPTVYLTGQAAGEPAAGTAAQGLRYWLLIANNRGAADTQGTPYAVGFAVHDRNDNRVAYGTGPLRSGDFTVTPR